jgi:thiol-disulfide isomerase/thioredoxin
MQQKEEKEKARALFEVQPDTTLKVYNDVTQTAAAIVMVSMVGCGPCKAIKPTFLHLQTQYPHLQFVYLCSTHQNSAQMQNILQSLHVDSAPTFLFYRQGVIKQRLAAPTPHLLSITVQQFSLMNNQLKK